MAADPQTPTIVSDGTTEIRYTPIPNGYYLMARAPTGIVGRDIRRRAELVAEAARNQIPEGNHTPAAGAGGKVAWRNMHLRDTIRVKVAYTDFQEPVAFVGSTHPTALWVHEGTAPHTISPRQAKVLVFSEGGQTIDDPKGVNHPGTRPNRYLTDNLRLAVT